MRLRLIGALSSAFFKSYFRSSRSKSGATFFSNPKSMLAIDIVLFAIPAAALQFLVGAVTPDLITAISSLLGQVMIALPLLMTSVVIVAGLMFELGQGSAIFSSEAVNWWPVSPREHVSASSLSTWSLCSVFLAFSAGITLPLAIKFGLFYIWPLAMLLSVFGLLLGSFILEILKAITNRVSAVAYKKSGRVTMLVRIFVLVILFSTIALVFQPLALSWFFGGVVAGIKLMWVLPFVWSSAAMVSLLKGDVLQTACFASFSLLFTAFFFEVASWLRKRYWAPVPISILINESTEYVPHGPIGKGLGFSPFASMLALKEFRALVRRKELARFIAIPVVIAVMTLAPIAASEGDMSGRGPAFLMAVIIPFIVPNMLSTISIGHEGNSIMHLLCLPVKATDLIKGKLAPSLLVSAAVTFPLIALLEILAPIGPNNILAIGVVSAMVLVFNSFIGLGVGARWPDYTIGARSRYITMKGFIIGFVLSGIATFAVYFPVALYILGTVGSAQQSPVFGLGLPLALSISMVLGSFLLVFSYIYCKEGVKRLLSNIN